MLVRRKTNEGFNSNLLHNGWFLNTIHRVLMCDDSFLNFSEHFCWTSLTGNPTNVYIIPLTNHSEIFETLQLRFLKLFPTETFQNTTAMNKQALVVEKKFLFLIGTTKYYVFINHLHLYLNKYIPFIILTSVKFNTKAEPKNKFLTLLISYSKELEFPFFSGKIILHTFEGLL